jgi:hypothetical protein|tara:strand:- start:2307 stop:2570 length:264 start_codon:yes stop_codon:yes gene_type:complete
MTKNIIDSCGIFLSSSISRHEFAMNFYQSYLLEESMVTCEEYKNKIQEAIDGEEDIDYIETLIKESDYYDSLLNFAIIATGYDDFIQ